MSVYLYTYHGFLMKRIQTGNNTYSIYYIIILYIKGNRSSNTKIIIGRRMRC